MKILQHPESDILTQRATFQPSVDTPYCQESHVDSILGPVCAFFSLAFVTVSLRLYARLRILKLTGWDDYIMLFALLMALGIMICFIAEANYGLGRHGSCIGMDDFETYLRWVFYHGIWGMVGVVAVKVSTALFLMRLAPQRWWIRFLWVMIVFLVCFCISCLLTIVLACIPVEATWDLSLRQDPDTTCFSNDTYTDIGVFNSTVNVITDFIFALVPIPIIVRLQINLRYKISIILILGLGLLACIAGIVKAVYQARYLKLTDPGWADDFFVWNMIELSVGITAASLPALKVLFIKLLESARSTLGTPGATPHGTDEHDASRLKSPISPAEPPKANGRPYNFDPYSTGGTIDTEMDDLDPCKWPQARTDSLPGNDIPVSPPRQDSGTAQVTGPLSIGQEKDVHSRPETPAANRRSILICGQLTTYDKSVDSISQHYPTQPITFPCSFLDEPGEVPPLKFSSYRPSLPPELPTPYNDPSSGSTPPRSPCPPRDDSQTASITVHHIPEQGTPPPLPNKISRSSSSSASSQPDEESRCSTPTSPLSVIEMTSFPASAVTTRHHRRSSARSPPPGAHPSAGDLVFGLRLSKHMAGLHVPQLPLEEEEESDDEGGSQGSSDETEEEPKRPRNVIFMQQPGTLVPSSEMAIDEEDEEDEDYEPGKGGGEAGKHLSAGYKFGLRLSAHMENVRAGKGVEGEEGRGVRRSRSLSDVDRRREGRVLNGFEFGLRGEAEAEEEEDDDSDRTPKASHFSWGPNENREMVGGEGDWSGRRSAVLSALKRKSRKSMY